jgi:hypothetical protein
MELRDPPMRIIAMQRFLIFLKNLCGTFLQRIGESMDLANSLIGGAYKSISWSTEGPKAPRDPKRWIKESEAR